MDWFSAEVNFLWLGWVSSSALFFWGHFSSQNIFSPYRKGSSERADDGKKKILILYIGTAPKFPRKTNLSINWDFEHLVYIEKQFIEKTVFRFCFLFSNWFNILSCFLHTGGNLGRKQKTKPTYCPQRKVLNLIIFFERLMWNDNIDLGIGEKWMDKLRYYGNDLKKLL